MNQTTQQPLKSRHCALAKPIGFDRAFCRLGIIGPSGKPNTNFLLSVPVGDESPVIVSGIAFADVAEKIARLKKGDALAVVGSLKPSTWTDKASGEERHGLNVTVQSCLSA